MNKFSKMTMKAAVVIQILALTLAACAGAGVSADNAAAPMICRATGDAAHPYEEVSAANDISPVPVNGCPASAVTIVNGKITICHATNSATNPYNEIAVSVKGLDGHGVHTGDIIPAPEGGCPKSLGATGNGMTKICHATDDAANPYEEMTVNSADLNDHNGHPNDIIPALANGCPASLAAVSNGKVTICHATSSATHPYNEITVSVNGLNGHSKHEGDIFPAPEGGCPASPVVINSNDKITICHATGSKKNPYNEITVSVNGLNGHDKHQGDIIPAPAGGCPTK